MVGAAILRELEARGCRSILTRTHAELDLTDAVATDRFFAENRPELVYLAAAKVGGIYANNTYPADFIRINQQIQINVIDAAFRYGVKKLLFLGSSCIYPKLAPQPIREEYLLTGPLEPTNAPYAIAKIAGMVMCESYNRQHGTNFIAAMPTNIYGPGDNFDRESSHVLAAMIRKFHDAKVRGDAQVTLWGTGSPRREFLYVDDLAEACLFLMDNLDAGGEQMFLNVGTGDDLSIRDLAVLVKNVVGFTGDITWDASMPDGTPRKLLDVSRLHDLGWRAHTPLEEGIAKTYNAFLQSPWANV